MSDFDPKTRMSAIWSGDSRRIAKGDAAGVVLEKLGRTEIEDISQNEEVQMGHRLQPVVARIFEDLHGVRLKELDVALTHPRHPWLRSHFDYVSPDNSFLVECKNYHTNAAQYFSESEEYPIRVPVADRAQCLHEAIVHGTDIVWLAVLFGGQRYREFRLTFSDEEKLEWTKRLSEIWGNVQTMTIPPANTPEQGREIWPQDDGHTIVATREIEQLCSELATHKKMIKQLEEATEVQVAKIMNYMNNRSALVAVDGKTLATWKTSKSSKRFSARLLEDAMPMVYEQFCVEQMGSRRFLIKN